MEELRSKSVPSVGVGRHRALGLALWVAVAGAVSVPHAAAAAQTAAQSRKPFHIPAQDLTSSLLAFARQADVQVVIDIPDTREYRSAEVIGKFAPAHALKMLIGSSPVAAEWSGPGTVIIRAATMQSLRRRSAAGVENRDRISTVQPENAIPLEIVVTARKKEEILSDVPVTVNVVSADTMFHARLDDLTDLSENVPNVSFTSDQAVRARLSIRGIGSDLTGQQGPGVGFYIDGVYQSSTTALVAPFFDLERVEVLKGPQGALYGRNALAGVLNYITPKPDNELKARAQVEGGRFDTYRVAAAIGGPLIKDVLYARVSAQHSESDGPWTYDLTGHKVAATKFNSLRGRFVLDASDALEFDLVGNYYRFKGPGLPETTVTDLQHLEERFILNEPNTSSSRNYEASLTATYDLDHFQILSRTSYSDLLARNDIDSDFSPTQLLRAAIRLPRDVLNQEIRFQKTGSGAFQWMVGASYAKEHQTIYTPLVGPFVGGSSITDSRTNTDVWSSFFDLTYTFADRLELGAGARFDSVRLDNVSVNTFITAAGTTVLPAFRAKLKENVWQPKLTARYRFSNDLTGFATVAKGYRQGGFNGGGGGTPFASYKGDLLWNYEAGLKWRSPNGRSAINASFFYIDLQRANGAVNFLTSGGRPTRGIAQFGTARSYGFEADAQFKISPVLSYGASMGVLDCQYRNVVANAPAGIRNGGTCVDSTRWNFRQELNFERPLGNGDKRLFAGASITAKGDTRIGVDILDRDYRQTQKAYFLVGASIGMKGRNWQVMTYGDNLFDERYATIINLKEGNAVFGATSDVALLGQPRTYGVRMRYDF